MNTTYLIDLENVNSGGFEGANNLNESDELIVFYSEKADTLKIHIITTLLKTKASIKFYKSKNGIMNAMDFDIVSVLGIVYNTEREFVIVSKDKGFDVVVERYRSFGKSNVSRRGIIGAPKIKEEPEVHNEQKALDTTFDDIMYSAPEVPEIEPDKFEAEISKAMEQNAAIVPEETEKPQEQPEQAKPEETKTEEKPKRGRGRPKGKKNTKPTPAPEPEKQPEPAPEPTPEPEVKAEPEEKPEPEQKPKPAPKKKKAAKNPEMSRLDKGKVNQFLNNLMGAKHEQPMTKDELKLIRETAEVSKTKNAFYNALRKKLGNEKGIALYNRVKDDFDKIAGFIREIKEG
ncbi:MAG: hypothetical protein J6O40_01380 [Ruminococcus sp.]|nr:hypothetical protein [Ruminococcus sp.]